MHPALFAAPALALALGLGGAPAHLPAAWKNLSEDQKATLQEVRELMKEGEYAEAKELAKEADLPALGHVRHHHVSPENRQAFKEAIENADYEAFSDLVSETPFADRVTEEKFDAMIEARDAFREGDHDGAREILKDAGLQKPPRMRLHRFGGDRQIAE